MQKLILLLLAPLFLFPASFASAETGQIEYNPQFIPLILGRSAPEVLGNIYRYLVVGGIVAGIFYIVLEGFEYITSEIPFIQQQKKSRIGAILAGIVLLFSVNFILGIFGIAPSIAVDLPFEMVRSIGFSLPNLPSGGPSSGSTGSCSPGVGACSPTVLRQHFPSDAVAYSASVVCQKESGGNSSALNRGCLSGRSADYSVGLFQINLLPANRCPEAFSSFSTNPPACVIGNQSKLSACVQKLQDPVQNIKKAQEISGNGSKWSHAWSSAKVCGIY